MTFERFNIGVVIIIVLLGNCSKSSGQVIDNSFNSLWLEEHQIDNKTIKKSNCIFPKTNDKIILFDQAFIQKKDDEFILDSTYQKIKNLSFPDTCSSLVEDSKLLLVGLANGDKIENGKRLKCVSFRLTDMPKVNDTAIFQFKLLSVRNDQDFRPMVYFSNNLLAGNNDNILNKKQFDFYERISPGSKNRNDLVLAEVKLLITERTKKYQWIHLVTDARRADVGLIFPLDAKWKPKEPNDSSDLNIRVQELEILFSSGSSSIKDSNMVLIKSFASEVLNPTENLISIQGLCDIEGDLTSNLILAKKRVDSVIDYLVELGVDRSRFVILQPIIGGSKLNDENRSCRLRLIHSD